LLSGVIVETMGPDVTLVDSAEATAVEVEALPAERDLLNHTGATSPTEPMLKDLHGSS
jgi:hypothetical protein